jgi:hypothetical protein
MLAARGAQSALCALGLLCALACARIEPPPGGPPDTKPPVLVSITPESLSVNPGFDGNVNFIFSEVVSEGGSPSQGFGTGDLEKLVLLSPTNKVPVVQWHRSRISVRPREGWRPNTVYRVQLLPGISDIRNNKGVAGGLVTFTTGAPVPDYTLRGSAYDWTTSQPMRGGLIQAVLEPDSLVYKGITDSSGAYVFGPLPRAVYLVYVGLDQNRNGRIDPREAYDSVRVEPDSGKVPEIFAFVHDTTPPRLTPPTVQDSVTINLTFTQKLDPYAHYDSTAVRVLQLPDSTPVPVLRVMTAAEFDSISKGDRAQADSLQKLRMDSLAKAQPAADTGKAAKPDTLKKVGPDTVKRVRPDTVKRVRPDTVRRVRPDSMPPGAGLNKEGPGAAAGQKPPAKLSRPPLSDRLVVRLGTPVLPGTRYLVEVQDVKNVTGVPGSPKAGFEVPKRPKPTLADSARVLQTRIDSALAKGDTTFADSLKQFLPADSLLKPQGGAPKKPPPPTRK